MTLSLKTPLDTTSNFLEQIVEKVGLREKGTSTILATEALALALQAVGIKSKSIYKQVEFGIYSKRVKFGVYEENQESSVVHKTIYVPALLVDEHLYHLPFQMTPCSWEAILLCAHQEFVSQEKSKVLGDHQGYETSIASTTYILPKFKDASVSNEKIKKLTEHILAIIPSLKSSPLLMKGNHQDFLQYTPVECLEDPFATDFLNKALNISPQISPRYYLDKKKLPSIMRRLSGVVGLYDKRPPKMLYVVDRFYKGDLCIQGDTAYLLTDHLDKAFMVNKPGQREDITIRQSRDILEKQLNPSSEIWTCITEKSELTLDMDDHYRRISLHQLDRSEKEILAAYQALMMNIKSPIRHQTNQQKGLRL